MAGIFGVTTICINMLMSALRITSARQRACCIRCGDEIINGREVTESGMTICMACAGHGYYQVEKKPGFTGTDIDEINILTHNPASLPSSFSLGL